MAFDSMAFCIDGTVLSWLEPPKVVCACGVSEGRALQVRRGAGVVAGSGIRRVDQRAVLVRG